MHTSVQRDPILRISSLLVVLVVTTLLAVSASGGLGPLPLDSTGSATTEGRVQSVVDVSVMSADATRTHAALRASLAGSLGNPKLTFASRVGQRKKGR